MRMTEARFRILRLAARETMMDGSGPGYAEESRHLHPFCLALRLVEQGRADIPTDVAHHFDLIIEQVRLLLRDAQAVKGFISPEAIALLLEIRAEPDLRDAIGKLPGLMQIRRETARSILSDMEQRFAFQD